MQTTEFELTTHKLAVELCGLTYYATEKGYFVLEEADAFTGFTKRAALQIAGNLAQDSAIKVTITPTN